MAVAMGERETLASDIRHLLADVEPQHVEVMSGFSEGAVEFVADVSERSAELPNGDVVSLSTARQDGELTKCRVSHFYAGVDERGFRNEEVYELKGNKHFYYHELPERDMVAITLHPDERTKEEPLTDLDLACARQLIGLFREH